MCGRKETWNLEEEGTGPQALEPQVTIGSVGSPHGRTYFLGSITEHGEDWIGLRSEAPSWCAVDRAKSRRLGSRRTAYKKYRDEGIESFFRPRRRRSSNVLTPEVVQLLYRGGSPSEVADELEIKRDTLVRPSIRDVSRDRRATDTRPPKRRPGPRSRVASGSASQVQRSLEDAAAPMGIACTRPLERVAAALGLLDGAPTEFQVCRDVSFGGVLAPCRR